MWDAPLSLGSCCRLINSCLLDVQDERSSHKLSDISYHRAASHMHTCTGFHSEGVTGISPPFPLKFENYDVIIASTATI